MRRWRKLDESLLEAAADLGCPRSKIFWEVTLPLSAPGVLAGALLCFIPAVGEFVIPDLLGGSQAPMIGQTIWTEFFGNKDWPAAAAVAVVLVGPVGDADRHLPAPDHARGGARLTMRKVSAFNLVAIVLGLAFLYLPIVILVIYSFNASQLVAVWGGWSTRWYAELINDAPLLDSAFISIRLALVSATAATILGTLAAVALVRFGRFRGRLLFASMIYAPLVMPEVITGLSMLLLFVAAAIDRGFWTVAIAHTTMAMCFVTVIVQARLVDFDMNLEEAAMDLGASPFETFLAVTLPLILPAIAAGWMLAFALSLDDLVIASFTTGPGATTLPIRIYSEVRLGVKPEMNAVCSIMIGVVGVAVIAASLLAKFNIASGTPARPQ